MPTDINREEIVRNGCIGGCCAAFTLPVSMFDLKEMLRAMDRGENSIVCENGYKRHFLPRTQIEYIIDMLIPLGMSDIDPATKKPLSETYKAAIQEDGTIMHDIVERTNGHVTMVGHKPFCQVYTCRHFDTENKICTAYESRPQFCKMYGRGCHYIGCNFDTVFEADFKKRVEEANLNEADERLLTDEMKVDVVVNKPVDSIEVELKIESNG